MDRIGIGLYGDNGHQIHSSLAGHPRARLVAIAAMAPEKLPPTLRDDPELRLYQSLDELLAEPQVELVSLCSPRRIDQAGDAIRCLNAGKHVYAEKPCALTEDALDMILTVARQTGRSFREMAGTAFEQPYLEMRRLVAAGTIGEVVQVLAQKSYPYHDSRPGDEAVDGGLTCQCGVHALRFIEHVAGTQVREIYALETRNGGPDNSELRMATSMMMRLENGGVATVIANYLNPRSFGSWGNETLRIFGTDGFIEAVDGGIRTRLVLSQQDCGELDLSKKSLDYFDLYLASLRGAGEMPLTLAEELHPTRMVIRARAAAQALEQISAPYRNI